MTSNEVDILQSKKGTVVLYNNSRYELLNVRGIGFSETQIVPPFKQPKRIDNSKIPITVEILAKNLETGKEERFYEDDEITQLFMAK